MGGEAEYLEGGEREQGLGGGTRVRGLGGSTVEAALLRNLKHSTVTSVCSTWAPPSRPSATPWKLSPLSCHQRAGGEARSHHKPQIKQSEDVGRRKKKPFEVWRHCKCKQYSSAQVRAGQHHHCSYFSAFLNTSGCVHAFYTLQRRSDNKLTFCLSSLSQHLIVCCTYKSLTKAIQHFYFIFFNVTEKCAGCPILWPDESLSLYGPSVFH